MLGELTPRELSERLARDPDGLVLLDVREPEEHEICTLDGALHVPLGDLARRASELDPERPTVVICHHGIRSAHAAAYLGSLDFDAVYNLSGGIDRWAQDVDPTMRRY